MPLTPKPQIQRKIYKLLLLLLLLFLFFLFFLDVVLCGIATARGWRPGHSPRLQSHGGQWKAPESSLSGLGSGFRMDGWI